MLNAKLGTDRGQLFADVDPAVVRVETVGHTIVFQGITKAVQDRVDILLVVDSGARDQACGVIDEGGDIKLLGRPVDGRREFHQVFNVCLPKIVSSSSLEAPCGPCPSARVEIQLPGPVPSSVELVLQGGTFHDSGLDPALHLQQTDDVADTALGDFPAQDNSLVNDYFRDGPHGGQIPFGRQEAVKALLLVGPKPTAQGRSEAAYLLAKMGAQRGPAPGQERVQDLGTHRVASLVFHFSQNKTHFLCFVPA